MVRFSLVPADWQVTRRAIKSIQQALRRAGYEWEFAFHVEPNPRGTGNHLHGWQHGDYVPQSTLQEACERSGLGYPDIRAWRSQGGGRTGYGLKGISYGMKHEDLEEFLDLNGGRLVHATRDFYRDGAGGERLTLGDAKDLLAERFELKDEGPWVLRPDPE